LAFKLIEIGNLEAMPPKPTFFPTPADFRAWLEAHHDKFRELLVGFYKKDSGKPSITWPESVAVALCFGWIDGVRKSIDEPVTQFASLPASLPAPGVQSTSASFEISQEGADPSRRPKSFRSTQRKKIGHLRYEQRKSAQFTREQAKQFRANKAAWEFLCSQGARDF